LVVDFGNRALITGVFRHECAHLIAARLLGLPPDASKKLAQQLILALKPFWLKWPTSGKGSFRK
jgi:hypothetical protein